MDVGRSANVTKEQRWFVDSRKVAEGAVLLGRLRIAYYQAFSPVA
jgi:hypothetical protein